MKIRCDYCGKPAVLVTGEKIYPQRPDLYSLEFWSCAPCQAWVGCHKNSDAIPLGRLADGALRRAKRAAHSAFDPIWRSGSKTRRAAYEWLSKQLGVDVKDCHIGMFDIERCNQVVTICINWRKTHTRINRKDKP
ncbi:zinc-finger-containing protein [Pantoea agglomerans]|uniref:zinc-finger-containing protein n=1 Tax=Enterobacter agglomerans TaxID=549 RepID=UPI003909F25F